MKNCKLMKIGMEVVMVCLKVNAEQWKLISIFVIRKLLYVMSHTLFCKI